MSFFDSLKRAFGMDNGYYGEEDDTQVDDMPEQRKIATVKPGDAQSDQVPASDDTGLVELPPAPVLDPKMKAAIFDGVVAIFNSALPEFLQKSVDPQRQSQLIAQALDISLQQYLDQLALEASVYAEAKLKTAADESQRESERLKKEMERAEQQRNSLREQQLSAERRRRALADKVKDLEAHIEQLEAEREQFDLEKKSMLNRLKLSDVQPGVIEELRQENEALRANAAKSDQSTEEIEALKTALEAAQEALAQHKEQVEMTQGMYNDLQNQLVDERQAHAKCEAELAETRKIFDSVVEMQQQMQQVESMIQKRDERIAKLKANNKKLKEEIASLRAEIEVESDDNSLFAMAKDGEIQYEKVVEPTPEEEAALAGLEDDFECPDWFVSEPAPGEGGIKPASDEPFGYIAPARKHTPDNDAQLRLF